MAGSAAAIRQEIRAQGDPAIAGHSQRFFKTGKGEYGEGDRFLGIRVPVIRKQVRKHRDTPIGVIETMLRSPWHEERLFAVLSMVDRFERGGDEVRSSIFDSYVRHRQFVNNWDIVDSSCRTIVGGWLECRNRELLYRLARSKGLWDRRIAIISTYHFILNNDFTDTLAISGMLLDDEEDLIHKAVGWMLREVGNRDMRSEERFLKRHYARMPRTMLRYAIEKFPESKRQAYLQGKA